MKRLQAFISGLPILSALLASCLMLNGCASDGEGGGGFSNTDFGNLVEAGMVVAGQDPTKAKQYGNAATQVTGAVSDVSPEKEWEIGGGVALKGVALTGMPVADQELQRYVNLVGRSVARQSSRPNLRYSFTVLQSDEVNAFSGPGGYVFITTGALKLMEDESELAGVLGHEVAHISEKHLLQMFKRQRWIDAAVSVASLKEDMSKYNQVAETGQNILFTQGLDQDYEFQADVEGTEFAALTGYDPSGLQRFLVKMANAQFTQMGGWGRTHPSTNERIVKLDTLVRETYDGAKGARLKERFQSRVGGKI